MSHSGFNCSLRNLTASLILLLIRLRTTAFPKALGVVNPNLDSKGDLVSGFAIRRSKKAAKYGQVIRTPPSYTLRYSAFFRIRTDFGNLVGSADSSFIANGELPTSTGATAGKHVAAIWGLHPGTETVHFGTTAVIGLERSLWHFFLKTSLLSYLGPVAAMGFPRRLDRLRPKIQYSNLSQRMSASRK